MSFRRSFDEASPLVYDPDAFSSASDDGSPRHVSFGSNEPQTPFAFRVAAAMYSFAVLGLFTSSIGVMLYPISQHYGLSDLSVSLIFLAGPIGYVFAAQSNDFIHSKSGQRGIALLGPVFHLFSSLLLAVHPPFWIALIAFAITALGIGLLDGSLCAWAGSMNNANTISGLLHGSFSVGAAVGPFVAGTIMSAGYKWYQWYLILFGASVIEFVALFLAFRYENASRYRREKEIDEGRDVVSSRAFLKYKATWLSAVYFLADVGLETAISGWVVSFMLGARHATFYLASLSSSGFWVGMSVGRLSLGAITDRLGVRRATFIYLLHVILFAVLFALSSRPGVSIVFITVVGFFMGPLFPSGIVVLTRLLPKNLHIAAVSFVAPVGQVGGALLPFAIGAVVEGLGIGVFRYALVILSILTSILWVIFSRLPTTASEVVDSRHEE